MKTENFHFFGGEYSQKEYFLNYETNGSIMNFFNDGMRNKMTDKVDKESTIFELRIFYSDKYTFYKRSFIGLDDVLSHMGGIFQFIILSFNYVVSVFSSNYLYINCLNDTKLTCVNSYLKLLELKHSIVDNNLISVRF